MKYGGMERVGRLGDKNLGSNFNYFPDWYVEKGDAKATMNRVT
jgi:hypothetical protein